MSDDGWWQRGGLQDEGGGQGHPRPHLDTRRSVYITFSYEIKDFRNSLKVSKFRIGKKSVLIIFVLFCKNVKLRILFSSLAYHCWLFQWSTPCWVSRFWPRIPINPAQSGKSLLFISWPHVAGDLGHRWCGSACRTGSSLFLKAYPVSNPSKTKPIQQTFISFHLP